MKKRLGLFLGILLSCTLLFSVFGNGLVAKAETNIIYNDVLVGTKNFNNTDYNSAKIGDLLLEPEIGWQRYDNTNTLISYSTSNDWLHRMYYPQGNVKFYKDTRTFYRGNDTVTVSFTANTKRLRINAFAGSKEVSVYADNVKIGEIEKYDKYKNNMLGFEYTFDTFGTHNIQIKVIGRNYSGNLDSYLSLDAIDVDSNGGLYTYGTKIESILNIESPVVNNTYAGSFNLSGYALNQSGIKAVKTYIDDVYSRDTQIGIQRTDIGIKYPSYPSANNSGFSTTYNVSDFSIGTHTMKIQAIGNDGTILEKLLYIYVNGSKVIVSSDSNVKNGWIKEGNYYYYYESGIKKVGWIQYNNKWYYTNGSGVMQIGWIKYNDKSYYLDNNGVSQVGLCYIGEKWYYFDDNGVMLEGDESTAIRRNLCITSLYTNILNRQPSQSDLDYWRNEFNYNGAAKVIETFMFGQEALNKNYTNTQYVNILYRVMYGRDADTTGLNYWVGRLNEGYPRRTLIAAFSYEQEFKNMCLKYNISSTPLVLTALTDVYGESTAYVTRLFRGLLNRDPDSGDLNYYVQKLGVDKVKGRDVLKEIMNSSEFKNATVKNEDFVTRVYKGILLREPDSEGYSYWTNFLNNGGSRDEMVNQFLNGAEYKNISNKYAVTY